MIMFDWLLYKGEKNWDTGFTLVEVMVSLALFSSVVTMAVGTLVVLIDANSKAQNAQLAVTNVSFALDSMTREIRTGLNYYCLESNLLGSNLPDGGTSKQNCLGGANALVFTESGSSLTSGYGSNRIA
ncbi:MAG: prepilin-type N-terminal cleavage/methylation domain-containing protein, partial [Acidimicrobiales bacterium]